MFSVVQQFREWFKQKDSALNTSAITEVTKSSMKLRYYKSSPTGAVVEKRMRSKGEQG